MEQYLTQGEKDFLTDTVRKMYVLWNAIFHTEDSNILIESVKSIELLQTDIKEKLKHANIIDIYVSGNRSAYLAVKCFHKLCEKEITYMFFTNDGLEVELDLHIRKL